MQGQKYGGIGKIPLFIFSMLEWKLDEPYPDDLIDNKNPMWLLHNLHAYLYSNVSAHILSYNTVLVFLHESSYSISSVETSPNSIWIIMSAHYINVLNAELGNHDNTIQKPVFHIKPHKNLQDFSIYIFYWLCLWHHLLQLDQHMVMSPPRFWYEERLCGSPSAKMCF